MLVTFSAVNYDLDGTVEIDARPSSTRKTMRRRVTRTATLNGEAAFYDGGFAEADRTLSYTFKPTSEAQIETFENLVRLHSEWHVSEEEGVFLVVPDIFDPGPDESSIQVLVKEKLA